MVQCNENTAPINVKLLRWEGGGGGRLGIGISVQMPHPRHLWIVKIATKSKKNVA